MAALRFFEETLENGDCIKTPHQQTPNLTAQANSLNTSFFNSVILSQEKHYKTAVLLPTERKSLAKIGLNSSFLSAPSIKKPATSRNLTALHPGKYKYSLRGKHLPPTNFLIFLISL